MASLRNFFNKILDSDRIYSREDIGEMSNDEFKANEKAIDYQMANLGVPQNADLANSDEVVYVHAYTRDDGTKVRAHYRSKHGRSNNALQSEIESATGAAAPLENQKADFSEVGKYNPFKYINHYVNQDKDDARELADIYLVGPQNAPESKEYKYIKPVYGEILNAKYNLTGNKKIDKNWSGIVYSENSTLSQNASNSKEMQEQIRKQFNLNAGRFISDKLEINFTQDPNLHLSVGHGTILNPHIDKDGYFTGLLYDKYDFGYLNQYDYYNNPFIYMANDVFATYGWILRDKNFYTLVPIKFKW